MELEDKVSFTHNLTLCHNLALWILYYVVPKMRFKLNTQKRSRILIYLLESLMSFRPAFDRTAPCIAFVRALWHEKTGWSCFSLCQNVLPP